MTTLLQQAFSEISQLSDEEQDLYAARILEELAAETAFDEKLAATAHLLEPMVRKAQENQRAGLALPFDFDGLRTRAPDRRPFIQRYTRRHDEANSNS